MESRMKPEVKRLRKQFMDLRSRGLIVAADSCLKCQRSAQDVFQLELHHKVPIKEALAHPGVEINSSENIATLCTDCHKAFHVSYEHMPFDQWLEEVPLTEAYKLLKEYRDERERYRKAQIRKHRNKH